ncbi:hypothetical protein D3C87_1715370 [compost metagenome]
MALPNQPTNMTMTMVAAEIGAAAPLSLGDSRVRTLAGKPSGAISMSDLRGKSAYTPPTIVCDTYADGSTVGPAGAFLDATASIDFVIQGGEAPFTVTWTRVSGSTQIAVQSPNPPVWFAAATANWAYSAVFRATVKDNRNNTVLSPDIEVSLRAGDAI